MNLITSLDDLLKLDQPTLREMAASYGIETHHRLGAEKIANILFEHFNTPQKKENIMQHPAQQEAKPLRMNTEDEVLKAIEKYAAKEGFVAKFPKDGTWIFSYNGAEESGHMSVPLRVIQMKAESVARGARKLRKLNLGDGELLAVG